MHPIFAEMHPIVVQMAPSPEQEPAVHARGCDVVVTAGAGTGKTRALVARYLSLVAEGLPLRSVVAVTFTRKAAREMRNRVRDEIRVYLERPDLAETERRRWESLYAELDAARIGTIHSLCTEILRAHPAEAGLDPRFEVLDEGQGNILLRQVVDSALAWATDDERLARLFALLGEKPLRGTLEALLGRRLDAEACFAHLPTPLWPAWQACLLPPLLAFVDDPGVSACLDELLAVRDDGTLARAEAAGDKLAAPLRRLLACWQEIAAHRQRGDWAMLVRCLPDLRREMPAFGLTKNWQAHDPRPSVAHLRARYDELLKEWLGQGIDLAFEQQLAETVPALQSLFVYAADHYERLKKERQALDFDDLEAGALSLLRGTRPALARWQGEIQALLVDEFQDTNERQRDLVTLLNGGRGRLFIVGDAKQSIYRFRGADVVVFRRERERIEREGGAALALETSYRAHRDLIAGLNVLLRPVLGEQADPARPWVEPFAPLRHYREDPATGFVAPHIELHLAVGTKTGGALERAAAALAARLVELMSGDRLIEDHGQARPLNPGDVAILCRASTSFGAYEDALEQAGIPFLTVAGRGFYGRPEVRDLLNILQALADPTDDLALAGALRSPAFGLSDAALTGLCQARAEAGVRLWDVLCRGQADRCLGEPDRGCAQRAAAIIARLQAQVGRTPVADLIKAVLDATDYRAALLQAGHTRGARNVSKLLSDAHASGVVGVGEFLEVVTSLRDSGTREGEARATAEGAVQLMSVHAAKGLEFPVVVVGDVTRAGGGGSGLLLDPGLGPLLPARDAGGRLPAVYRQGKKRADAQEAAESERLFYVVATRARELLILSGCIDCADDGSVKKPGGWLDKLAAEVGLGLEGQVPAYNPEGAAAHRLDLAAGATPVAGATRVAGATHVACTVYEPGYAWQPHPCPTETGRETATVLPPPLLDPLAAEAEDGDQRAAPQDRPGQRVWRVVPAADQPRAPAWLVGSLVHEALSAWRFPAPQDSAWDAWAAARARSYGLTDARQLADAARHTRQLLLRFRSHALYDEIDGAEVRLHEVPYSLLVDGRVESGIVDALYRRDGAWTLVEFKTDRVNDLAEMERLLATEGYAAQAQRYVAATTRLLGQAPRVVVCWLNLAGSVVLWSPAP